MKISLSEVWNFSDLIKADEKGWTFSLHAGRVTIPGVTSDTLRRLKADKGYDTEILPSIFTFREILWQPDVFTEAAMSLPGLRILNAFCEETAGELNAREDPVTIIYTALIEGLGACCQRSVEAIEKGETLVTRILGDLRTEAFPIIKFFIYHPENRIDYHRDAVNRLNYAVKVMLTQFHGRYTALEDPYWEVQYSGSENKIPRNPTKENARPPESPAGDPVGDPVGDE